MVRSTGRKNDQGLHTVRLPSPPVIPVHDTAHPFAKRLRGEIGQFQCVTCGEGHKHPNHAIAGIVHPSMIVGGSTTCPDCQGPKYIAAKRCRTCSLDRHAKSADRQNLVYQQSREAARREESS